MQVISKAPQPKPNRRPFADLSGQTVRATPDIPTTVSTSPDSVPGVITGFTPGTTIITNTGKICIECLSSGARVLTRDRGFQPVRLISKRRLIPGSQTRGGQTPGSSVPSDPRPVLIRKGALGHDMPERDMLVPPRHRLLSNDRKLLTDTGEFEVLIEASDMIGLPGISRADLGATTYIQLLFDEHEIILSDNIWTESFHLIHPTTAAFPDMQNEVISEQFPARLNDAGVPVQKSARACLKPAAFHPVARKIRA